VLSTFADVQLAHVHTRPLPLRRSSRAPTDLEAYLT
jgi:hypothetical protein